MILEKKEKDPKGPTAVNNCTPAAQTLMLNSDTMYNYFPLINEATTEFRVLLCCGSVIITRIEKRNNCWIHYSLETQKCLHRPLGKYLNKAFVLMINSKRRNIKAFGKFLPLNLATKCPLLLSYMLTKRSNFILTNSQGYGNLLKESKGE